jgi:anti-sigma28 factor (negative regulator of flagellin synthesis)
MVNGVHNGMSAAVLQQQSKTQQKNQDQNINKTEEISRVDEIKQQIEAGTYKVDVDKSAKALLDTLI